MLAFNKECIYEKDAKSVHRLAEHNYGRLYVSDCGKGCGGGVEGRVCVCVYVHGEVSFSCSRQRSYFICRPQTRQVDTRFICYNGILCAVAANACARVLTE